MNHFQTRPLRRVFYDGSFIPRLPLGVGVLLILFMALGITESQGEEQELNDDQARQQCFKGKTIYCLALGMKEEKAGHPERALELFRSACKHHPTPGHLRACTPLLSLAWKLGQLGEEAAPLEARCQTGDTITCFYLGKEYLKLVEVEKAARHLEPLCRNRFRPPDSDDYGPCYHLAKAYEQFGQWHRARQLYELDCNSKDGAGQPSCVALEELTKMEDVHRELAQKGIRKFDPVESVLLFVVLISVLHVWVWFKGGQRGLKYLSQGAPMVVTGASLIWVFWPGKPEYPNSQWAVIFFALLLAIGVALSAHRALHPPNVTR